MKKRRWKKRLGIAILATAVLLPPIAFGISNLFLISPKGCAYIASHIQRRIALETSVQGASWSPWNGFTIYGLNIAQPAELRKAIPAPLVTVQSIRIHPVWTALLKRKLSARRIEILKPDLSIPIELLSMIPQQPALPELAAKPPDLAAANRPPEEVPSAPGDVPAIPAPIDPLAETEVPPIAIESVPERTVPTVWVEFTDARLKIVSAMSRKKLYRIARIDGRIPVGGGSAESELKLAGIQAMGAMISESAIVPLEWKSPMLTFGEMEGKISGLGFKLVGRIGMVPGIPFVTEFIIPKQDGREIQAGATLHAKLGSVAGRGRFQGQLVAPGSWQGQFVMQAASVDADFSGNRCHFDQGQALVVFQNGILRCIDARLTGETVSVICNAMALSDGRAAGIARIIAAPEALVAISKFTQPDASAPQLTPLSTPQRAALDLQIFGRPGSFHYQPNPMAKPIPLQ